MKEIKQTLLPPTITVKSKPLTDKEISKGRVPEYWERSAEEQREEDKRLGILDWDGE